jgi:hypothetical protein
MKKLLVVLGSIFLLIIVLGAIGIAFVAIRGAALDKESKTYADRAILAIVTNWSEKELLDRASSELKQAATQQQIDEYFLRASTLGRLQKCESAQGQALMSATTQGGKMISARYTSKATFEKGEATVTLGLIKHGDQWQILNFDARPPQFIPHNQNWEVERDAQPSEKHPYGGFWKIRPQDEFGFAIGPVGADSYYVSLCGPGGCFAKGEYRPITKLVGDPAYRIVDSNTIEVNGTDGFTAFHRSAGRRNDLSLQP